MNTLVAELPFQLFIDCQGTVDCIANVRAYAAAVDNPRAHLWTRFFACFDGGEVTAHKTLAHASLVDVDNGRSTHWERAANGLADKYAKLRAALHGISRHMSTISLVWPILCLRQQGGQARRKPCRGHRATRMHYPSPIHRCGIADRLGVDMTWRMSWIANRVTSCSWGIPSEPHQ